MLKMTIKLTIETGQGDSPHKNTLDAIMALHRAVTAATEDTPTLGGSLQNEDGRRVGSYLVKFNN